MARISTFEVGHCSHPACSVQRGAGWASCLFPARAYLIEAGSGRWLWDTGYSHHFVDHTREGLFALYRRVTPVHFDASQSLLHQLQAQGLQRPDITGLILSHFHGDHMAGLRDFGGVPLVCSHEAWRVIGPLRGVSALRRGFVPGLMPPDFESRVQFVEQWPEADLPTALAPFTRARPVPGSAGEVWVVDLPGHAAGHLGAFVATDTGWVLLASDAAWTHANYREMKKPSPLAYLLMHDGRAYDHTLGLLQGLDRRGTARICLTHEGVL
jgi:glyoxylase-like metal-dependent hydrolase (beta-lactamase superfamily II)